MFLGRKRLRDFNRCGDLVCRPPPLNCKEAKVVRDSCVGGGALGTEGAKRIFLRSSRTTLEALVCLACLCGILFLTACTNEDSGEADSVPAVGLGFNLVTWAQENDKPILFGVASDLGLEGNLRWKVLSSKEISEDRALGERKSALLLSEDCLGETSFGLGESWEGSEAQAWCRGFYERCFSPNEKAALVEVVEKESVVGPWRDLALSGDSAFFLAAPQAKTESFGFLTDEQRCAKVLRTGEPSDWWLRTVVSEDELRAWSVGLTGGLRTSFVGYKCGARPAVSVAVDEVVLCQVVGDEDIGRSSQDACVSEGVVSIPEVSRVFDGSVVLFVRSEEVRLTVREFRVIGSEAHYAFDVEASNPLLSESPSEGEPTCDLWLVAVVVSRATGELSRCGRVAQVSVGDSGNDSAVLEGIMEIPQECLDGMDELWFLVEGSCEGRPGGLASEPVRVLWSRNEICDTAR